MRAFHAVDRVLQDRLDLRRADGITTLRVRLQLLLEDVEAT